jgi:hypothetical protein
MEIRTLRADEIECRVQQVKSNGCVLLLYKDARCDMRILDEVYGIDGWEREHQVVNGNLYCTVRIWSEKRQQWISKQDVGTESNTEKQKGEASDSFKRACFNIGIGRELYSAPFIWINLDKTELKDNNGRYSLDYKVKFEVKEIEYNEDREISKLIIVDQNGKERFKYNTSNKINKVIKENPLLEEVYKLAKEKGYGRDLVNKTIISKGFSLEKFDNEAYETIYKGFYDLEGKTNKMGA